MTFRELLIPFQKYLQDEKRYSQYTLRNYNHALETFFTWAKITDPSQVDKNLIRSFLIEFQRTHSRRTLHNWASAIRSFYNYHIKLKNLSQNPWDNITIPKLDKPLPKFLTQPQIKDLINAPLNLLKEKQIQPFQAQRDSIILELLYGAGLRVSELCNLNHSHIDYSTSILKITGKGSKQRQCPAGSHALNAIKTFTNNHFPDFKADSPVVLSNKGTRINPRQIQLILKKYLKLTGLPLDLTPHKLRHSFATHMVSNGADLRVVQELMGHASLSTTQIYTHIDFKRLQQIHQNAHPRA